MKKLKEFLLESINIKLNKNGIERLFNAYLKHNNIKASVKQRTKRAYRSNEILLVDCDNIEQLRKIIIGAFNYDHKDNNYKGLVNVSYDYAIGKPGASRSYNSYEISFGDGITYYIAYARTKDNKKNLPSFLGGKDLTPDSLGLSGKMYLFY